MGAEFSAARLAGSLSRRVEEWQSARYCVAYSGGVDSTALLHALSLCRREHAGLGLRALHVNHHLHPQADDWARHCAQFAAQARIPFQALDARVEAAGESPEAAARTARYHLLEAAIEPGEYLLTAHHADDQLETVLLQLARGAGIAGLSAMPHRAAFGAGWHIRPLLGETRAALLAFAGAQALRWIDDSSNADQRFDRNALRHQILPALRGRWPGIAATVGRSAEHMAEAQSLLDVLARQDLAAAHDGATLNAAVLRALDPARTRNVLRYWIASAGLRPPSTIILEEICTQMLDARADATPHVSWGGGEMRLYQDRLYVSKVLEPAPTKKLVWELATAASLLLPAGLGELRRRAAVGAEPALATTCRTLEIRWRSGSERLRLAPQGPHKTLRNLFQEAGMVPWMRHRVPLLYGGKQLVAVGDLWVAEHARAGGGEPGWVVEWRDHPQLY